MKDNPDDREEHQLSERLQNGNPEAVEELFNNYFHQVYSIIFHAVGWDRSTAEDVTQETFLSAVRSVGNYKGKSKPYTWLLSIAHHKIADYYRWLGRERHYKTVSLESFVGTRGEIPDGSEPTHSHLEVAEAKDIVTRALVKLPYRYREVLVYKYVEEMSVKQISQIMGRSPKSVEALLSRARNILKSKLDKVNEGEILVETTNNKRIAYAGLR